MFRNSICKISTKTNKNDEGISVELKCSINLSEDENAKLKEFREDFAKSSTIHFHFDEEIYLFSQNKYFKKKQYIKNPPNLNDLENEFKSDIRKVLTQYKNFVDFNNLQNIDETKEYTINELLADTQ